MGKRPDHRGLPAGKRQQRQHRPPLEPLERSVGMRLLAGEIRDHRRLTVILLGGGDAGVLAHERIGAIGADHEPAADAAAVAQFDRCRVRVDAQPFAARRRDHFGVQSAPQRILQDRILERPRELGHAGAVSIELDARRSVVAEDTHGVDGREPVCRERLPSADAAQEIDIARAEGVDPAVERSGLRPRRALLVGEQRHRQAARGARQARADRAAAHYDEIVLHEGL